MALQALSFLLFERTRAVPSRELETVVFCTDVIVLASARTVKDMAESLPRLFRRGSHCVRIVKRATQVLIVSEHYKIVVCLLVADYSLAPRFSLLN